MTLTPDGVEIPYKEYNATAIACERIATALEKLVSLLEKEIEYWEEVDEDDEEIEGQANLFDYC